MTELDAAVCTAARGWVAAITSHPGAWAGGEDFALIEAVTAANPGMHTDSPHAHWCPTCGNCTCPMTIGGARMDTTPGCPIHGPGQRHHKASPTT